LASRLHRILTRPTAYNHFCTPSKSAEGWRTPRRFAKYDRRRKTRQRLGTAVALHRFDRKRRPNAEAQRTQSRAETEKFFCVSPRPPRLCVYFVQPPAKLAFRPSGVAASRQKRRILPLHFPDGGFLPKAATFRRGEVALIFSKLKSPRPVPLPELGNHFNAQHSTLNIQGKASFGVGR